jgi:putative tryptophan/tyrosine transport system substrate-binding protein
LGRWLTPAGRVPRRIEEQNIVIEYRWAEGNYEHFPSRIAELLGQNVAVIVTAGTPASLAVKKATNSVPLVIFAHGSRGEDQNGFLGR